jgi:Domain of unknown function DUF11
MARGAAILGSVLISLALASVASPWAASASTDQSVTDLAITQSANVRHAKVGQVVTFTSTAVNNGPDAITDSLDVHPTQAVSLEVVGVVCDRGVSSDGLFCQYGPVGVGEQLTTVYTAMVLATGSKTASLTVCVTRETADFVDPDLTNNCATTSVRVIGRSKA